MSSSRSNDSFLAESAPSYAADMGGVADACESAVLDAVYQLDLQHAVRALLLLAEFKPLG